MVNQNDWCYKKHMAPFPAPAEMDSPYQFFIINLRTGPNANEKTYKCDAKNS